MSGLGLREAAQAVVDWWQIADEPEIARLRTVLALPDETAALREEYAESTEAWGKRVDELRAEVEGSRKLSAERLRTISQLRDDVAQLDHDLKEAWEQVLHWMRETGQEMDQRDATRAEVDQWTRTSAVQRELTDRLRGEIADLREARDSLISDQVAEVNELSAKLAAAVRERDQVLDKLLVHDGGKSCVWWPVLVEERAKLRAAELERDEARAKLAECEAEIVSLFSGRLEYAARLAAAERRVENW